MKALLRYRFLLIAIIALILIEVILRISLGLGNPILSTADPYTGYRFQPNQNLVRFGRTVQYNQYSQRSEPISVQKAPETLRILMLGDSVLNGGSLSNQNRTITELLESLVKTTGRSVEVLNASAGSWGIGNQRGYLREFGFFNSDVVIFQIGTHDLVQQTSISKTVGCDPNFPTHRPWSAIQEGITRYVLPNLQLQIASRFGWDSPTAICLPPPIQDLNAQFHQNMGFLDEMIQMSRDRQIHPFVLFTPNQYDLIPQVQTPPYQPEFFQHLKTLNVPVIDTHHAWSSLPPKQIASYFRDGVHLTEIGNQAAANLLFQKICLKTEYPLCSPLK